METVGSLIAGNYLFISGARQTTSDPQTISVLSSRFQPGFETGASFFHGFNPPYHTPHCQVNPETVGIERLSSERFTLKVPRCGRSKEVQEPSSEVKFSIERILGISSNQGCLEPPPGHSVQESRVTEACVREGPKDTESHQYSWLNCTRYKPPKLQRLKKREGSKKRTLGRNPRVPFTQHQVIALEQKFAQTHYLSSMDVAELSLRLDLTENRVKIWFQNRRARERREREAKYKSDPTGFCGSGKDALCTSTKATEESETMPVDEPTSAASIVSLYQSLQTTGSAFTPVHMLPYKQSGCLQ